MFDTITLLIVLVPLLAAVANGLNLFFRETWFDWRTVQRLTVGATLVSFIGSIWIFWQVLGDPTPKKVMLYDWLASGKLKVEVAFLVDTLSALMMLVVTGFSFLIGKFSINYMHNDFSFSRYFSSFALFVFAMLVLVMGDNYVMLFVGWEAVGVCSYLLIGHYYERGSAARAGTKAFVMNRFGDAGFLVGLFLIATHFQTFNYQEVMARVGTIDTATATAIGLCLLLGAIGKSAQLPLGTWLAKAMEGPTPSSALIHAATMVTAGVYMIVRSQELYNAAPNALLVVAIVGAATALYGAMAGQTTTDIKGILAFSTTTQLGLMFLACGLGAYAVAIFHLVAHAFLKSFLFLTAPSILHHLHGHADPAKLDPADAQGSPRTYSLLLLVTIILVGAPLAAAGLGGGILPGTESPSFYVLIAGGIMAGFAALYYALDLTSKTFADHSHPPSPADDHGHDHAEEKNKTSTALFAWPLVLIASAAAIGIALGVLPGGLENGWFRSLLDPIISQKPAATGGSLALTSVLFVLMALILLYAWFTALFLDRFKAELPGLALLKLRGAYNLALNRFWLDDVYNRYVVGAAKSLGNRLDRFDAKVIDRIVGAPAQVERALPPAATWERRYLTAKAGGVSLLATSTPSKNWEDQAREEALAMSKSGIGGVPAWTVDAASQFSVSAIPQNAVGGMAAWSADVASSVANWAERDVVRRAAGLVGSLTELLSKITGWVEGMVFEAGVHKGMPVTGRLFGRLMVGIENVIGHPAAAAIIVAAALIAVLAGVI